MGLRKKLGLRRNRGGEHVHVVHQPPIHVIREEINAVRNEIEQDRNGNAENYAANEAANFEAQKRAVERLPDPPKPVERSVCVLGKTSTGKSSWINRTFGTTQATSNARCTDEFTPPVFDGEKEGIRIKVHDVFGESDEDSYHTVEHLMTTKTMHKALVFYTGAVDHVRRLAELVAALRIPATFVRNKMDAEGPEMTRAQIYENDLEKLQQLVPGCKLILGSSRTGEGEDEVLAAFLRD